MLRRLILTLPLLGLLGAGGPAPAGETVVVATKNYAFVPAEITIRPGTRVRWENRDRRQYHSVYFEQLGDPEGDYFFPGESRERVFDTPGTYPYICEPHWKTHGMTGVVHVVE
jgi:plastocyanin